VFLFGPPGVTWPGIKEMAAKLRGLKAETLIITDQSHRDAAGLGRTVTIPVKLASRSAVAAELYTPIPYVVPAQLFAAHLAELKGFDPDRPRTLTKVTRTL
jgi:glucosamine--fructose-6-phosphate aminotransferase (isomerizing)